MRDPTVWVIQESWSPKSDLSSAQRYGTIKFLLTSRDKPSAAPGPCALKIRKALAEYRPGDYFCYTLADPAGAFLVGMIIRDMNLDRTGPIQWLRWERERGVDGGRTQNVGFFVPSTMNLRENYIERKENDGPRIRRDGGVGRRTLRAIESD